MGPLTPPLQHFFSHLTLTGGLPVSTSVPSTCCCGNRASWATGNYATGGVSVYGAWGYLQSFPIIFSACLHPDLQFKGNFTIAQAIRCYNNDYLILRQTGISILQAKLTRQQIILISPHQDGKTQVHSHMPNIGKHYTVLVLS